MNISPPNVWQWREMKLVDRVLFAISIFCGVSYLLAPFLFASQIRAYWPINTLIKGLAVSPLAVIAWRWLKDADGTLLSVALIFSSLGDIFLSLRNGNWFVFGLLSFLIAHLFFIVLWVRNWPKPLRISKHQNLLLAIVLFYLIAMLWWMLPVPGLSVPVAIYMCVLTTMVMTSALADSKGAWIVAGAVLFLISDSLIALSTFKHVVGGKLAGFLIWSTYYLAQYFMTFGFLSDQQRANTE